MVCSFGRLEVRLFVCVSGRLVFWCLVVWCCLSFACLVVMSFGHSDLLVIWLLRSFLVLSYLLFCC